MTRISTFCLAAFLAVASAGPTRAIEIRSYGIGRLPCAEFLASPEHVFQGSIWMLGYWTAMNIAGPTGDHMVGKHAEMNDIIADVKTACKAEPNIPLYGAIDHVYKQYQKDGK